ncbi:Cell division protein ZapA [BD1-7 clade bacterium]|uniref:Cell division protein ZapA n=1 Tax=BD1-7 clade bacterium TaxID=2029982 RepID=A0A5S9MRJ9_9GAMM|nr:Cell division protein ZapA [BD1-7 clade bacterium]CAA0084493.1 Cell division protein ZapA [BD1-7 clade bacterium]CAA0115423.1 Cell division protein ZapA [BD1-7 clade bacterium]
MTAAPNKSVIKLLGKEYQIACSPEEEKALEQAAHYLDEQMRGIRDSGKVIGLERIAIMAALNISHELLSTTTTDESEVARQQAQVQKLNSKLDDTLHRLKQIKI